MKSIWRQLPKPFFVLAPMDDVTDTVFRRIILDCAPPDLFFTEFVSVDGLQSAGREALMKKLLKTDQETPIIVQIWGLVPDNYQKVAAELVDMGYDGIDINMGCPQSNVVGNGCCSALINNRPLTAEIIAATKAGAAGKVPVSVKCRTGFNEIDLSWHKFLLEQDIDALIVHGRTTKEMSKVANNWDVIGQIKQLRDEIAPDTVFVGNGDIKNRQKGVAVAEKYGLDGVMIGRGVFSDPYVFAQNSDWMTRTPQFKLDLYKKQIELFEKTWGSDKNPATLKRFAKVYVNGFDGASALRAKLMEARDSKQLLSTLNENQVVQVS